MFDLTGKSALVTGASGGIGGAIAKALHGAGASVGLSGTRVEPLEALAAELGERAFVLPCNLGVAEAVAELPKQAAEAMGAVDILVNNAGLSPLYSSLEDVSEELFDKVMGVNLRGPFRLTARLGGSMAARGNGSVINISSVEAARPTVHALPYAAAKAGLEAITVGFARDLAPHVRVNAIRCGMFATDIAASWGSPADVQAMAAERIPLGRVGDPSEIIGTSLFLASDASTYCTGTTITLDGGLGL